MFNHGTENTRCGSGLGSQVNPKGAMRGACQWSLWKTPQFRIHLTHFDSSSTFGTTKIVIENHTCTELWLTVYWSLPVYTTVPQSGAFRWACWPSMLAARLLKPFLRIRDCQAVTEVSL